MLSASSEVRGGSLVRGLCVGIGLLCLGPLNRPARGQDPLPHARPIVLTTPRNHLQGAGSCSAVACHGGVAPSAHASVLRNEHSTWTADDPHSLAYQTLFSGRSERIARKLAGRSATPIPAHQDERCLACHTTPRPAAERDRTAWMTQDGVSCEACHGAAEKWLGPHTAGWWTELPPQIKEAKFGFRNTKELARRATMCAECHVGGFSTDDSAPKDVNHDLIAAGHPRLNFEFAAYADNLPRHWVEEGRNASPDFPALAWSVGQMATTKAALELLQSRAEAGGSTWPEFSEYGCFSCHHELADEPWRRNRTDGVSGFSPGAPRWGSWYLPMNRALADEERAAGLDPNGEWTLFEDAIKRLVGEMGRPIPDPRMVQEIAGSALGPLGRRLEAATVRKFSTPDVESILATFNSANSWKGVDSWDHAAQRYLAIVPFRQAWMLLAPDRRESQEKLKTELDELLKRLRFEATLDSPPRGFAPADLRDTR